MRPFTGFVRLGLRFTPSFASILQDNAFPGSVTVEGASVLLFANNDFTMQRFNELLNNRSDFALSTSFIVLKPREKEDETQEKDAFYG